MDAQAIWRLAESEVELLASRRFHPEAAVSVMSILCNWGPPVPRRSDPDFLDIWAVADQALRPTSIAAYGCESVHDGSDHSQWHDIGEFVKSKDADVHGRNVGLYHFSGLPVDEFVVRLTDSRGKSYYDNNGGYGINYRLRRYHGFQFSCMRAAAQYVTYQGQQSHERNWILVFPRLVEIQGSDGIASVSLE